MGSPAQSKKKIAVVGAGMAGLCTLRHFATDPNYDIVAFERMNTIAGIWNYPAPHCEQYTDEPETSTRYCRIYRDLRTNSPRDITGYPDYPVAYRDESYIKRELVLQYYHTYAEHFGLLPHIKFRHQVSNVTPIRDHQGKVVKWKLDALDLENNRSFTDTYDSVVVCNGHYHKPNIPKLESLELFKGPVTHSHQYRFPELYAGKTVLVIGARSSAMDIACELIPYAKEIIISRRFQASVFKDKFPNVIETTEIAGFGPDHIILKDGTTRHIDCVILCTGFVYDFPFLSKECNVHATRGRVFPLYRHLIHCENPSMAFVGLANMAVFSHVADCQIRYYKAYLDGKVEIPSTEEMLADSEKDLQTKLAAGQPEHMAHEMTVSQWDYMDMLAKEAGFPSYEPASRGIFEANIKAIRSTPYAFRNFRVEKVDRDSFIRIPLEATESPACKPAGPAQVNLVHSETRSEAVSQ